MSCDLELKEAITKNSKLKEIYDFIVALNLTNAYKAMVEYVNNNTDPDKLKWCAYVLLFDAIELDKFVEKNKCQALFLSKMQMLVANMAYADRDRIIGLDWERQAERTLETTFNE